MPPTLLRHWRLCRVRSGIMSIVLFPANILLHLCIRFPPRKVDGLDLYILFLETALVSLCIVLKYYSMDIHNLRNVLILPGVSGNMSMLFERLMCINYHVCNG